MPNHVTTVISCDSPAELKIIADALAGEGERLVDFNKILPAPDGFFSVERGVSHSAEIRAKNLVGYDENKDDPDFMRNIALSNRIRTITEPPPSEDEIEEAIGYAQNYTRHGFFSWLDWNIANWGTKWNAYDVEINDRIKLETAWSCPRMVLLELSKQNPDIQLHIQYADEDTGSNCGSLELLGGEIVSEDIAKRYDDMSPAEKYKWVAFALSLTDPDTTPAQRGYGSDGEYSEELYEKNNPEEFA